ncbi:hypothetical protein PybrP1_007045 [[Pythium] brassicae (nom. inval.)]|nr:hypothetical protein PybrP1_007045 [[Pythium] brassicae (nom. inval.)]
MAVQPLRLGLRGLQFVLSLVALATIAAGFRNATAKGYDEDFNRVDITLSAGSPGTTFGMLMTYTTMLYGLWAMVAVEMYAYVPRPTPMVDRYIDAFLAVVLLIAGIVLATSDYVAHCSLLEDSLRCGSLKAGVAFTFIAAAAFLATFGLNFLGASQNIGTTSAHFDGPVDYTAEAEYHGESTPKDALSPIGGSKTPEAHV